MAVDWKKLLSIMLVYVSLITFTWLIWLRYEFAQPIIYITYLIMTLACVYLAAFKAQRVTEPLDKKN